MATKAKEFFRTLKELHDEITDAERGATKDAEVKFVDDMSIKIGTFGLDAFMSEKQHAWLTRIADKGR